MRQRKVKNVQERIAALAEFSVEDAKALKGDWKKNFDNDNDIYLELGCGKGQFSLKQAEMHPENNYIAVEGQETIVLRALEKVAMLKLTNIKVVRAFIQDITEYFEDGELAGIYLNFSDPWPKDRHAKRRLTHGRFLKGYARVLKKDGTVEFKTDNEGLFNFSIDEIKNNDFEILESSRDLHNSEFNSRLITTEYEDKFRAINKNINYVKFREK